MFPSGPLLLPRQLVFQFWFGARAGLVTSARFGFAIIAGTLLLPSLVLAENTGEAFFEKRVRPVLSEHCFQCHATTADKVKGGLVLDTREGLMRGGESGVVILPGDPEHSLLIKAVQYTDKDLRMPPKDKKLSDGQIADLVTWVKQGAFFPAPATGLATNHLVTANTHWSFQPPGSPIPPEVKGRAWTRTPLDRFILAKLEEHGCAPAPPADRATLLRRVTYDLTGLPPTLAELDAFATDASPDAWAKVIERLLASPRYGERWARHWLDVARYTDSFDARGIGGVADVPEAYRYRDWVVESFNRDLPYDQFILHQLAGDRLPSPVPGAFYTNGLVATTAYVIGEWGLGDADKEKMLTDIVDDQVDFTARAFLGLTLACARCHDHKFDPLTTRDYYALVGIFFSSHILPDPGRKTDGSAVSRIPLATPEELRARRQTEERLAEVKRLLERNLETNFAGLTRELLPRMASHLVAASDYHHRPVADAALGVADWCARERKDLVPDVVAEWERYLRPPEFAALDKPINNVGGRPELRGLQRAGMDTPSATANPGDGIVNYATITLPPRSVAVHPSPKAGVAVAWRAPQAGPFLVRGRVADADANCGNGITWQLDIRGTNGLRSLARGEIENGGSQTLSTNNAALEAVVGKGELLQLSILPKGEYSCDSTVLELEITGPGETGKSWSLARDVVPDLPAVARGGSSVWQFLDLAGDRSYEVPSGSALADWVAVARAGDRARVESAASAVQSALLSFKPEPDKKSAWELSVIDPRGAFWKSIRANETNLPPAARVELATLRKESASLEASLRVVLPVAHGLQEGGTPKSAHAGFKDARIHIRGRYDRLGDTVPRGVPAVVAGAHPPRITEGSGRLELARWVTSAENPLTARVMVNRIWQQHFGEGLVRTPNNFGKLGEPPSHPELLDWLAREFIASGWSVKAMHRAILLSATYQQSSVPVPATRLADPENRLLGHAPRRRLEAEALRDTLLQQAGKLDSRMGGPAIRELENPRRTLYLMTIRSDRANYRMLFDAPDPVSMAERRNDSIVAPQALFLLNHPFVGEQAGALARRALAVAPGDRERVQWLYRTLYGRPPRPEEMELALGTVGDALPKSWEILCQALVCANEFLYLD